MAKVASRQLTKAQVARYRQILENKAAELRSSLLMPFAPDLIARREEPLDADDLCSQSHEEWILLHRNSLDVSLLRQIQEALARIEGQSYGICLDCDAPISTKRLDAVPWAKYCLACQERRAAWQS